MANEKFYLVFSENPNERVEIDEPVGFNDVDFLTKQKDKGHGRDFSLNGGESSFKFVDQRNHYLDRLLYYNHYYGFESDVKLIIVLKSGQEFVSELDFAGTVTDDLTFFQCKTIQQSSLQIVNRRRQTKIDLLSNKDLDGNPITPLVPEDMLLQAKPKNKESIWRNNVERNSQTDTFGNDGFFFPICDNLVKADILDSSSPIGFFHFPRNSPQSLLSEQQKQMTILVATENLYNVKISIKGLSLNIDDIEGVRYTDKNVRISYGSVYGTNVARANIILESTQSKTLITENKDYNIVIPELLAGEYLYTQIRVFQGVGDGVIKTTRTRSVISGCELKISVDGFNFNTVCPSFRLIDVMKHVVKSISGLNVVAPRYDVGGEFYDNRLLNGNLLRFVTDKPFYVSLEDIEKSIMGEHNADSEINNNGDVFFGIEQDYYKNNEMMVFDNTQFSSMTKEQNPKYKVNTFKFRYNKYQSLKENEEVNSSDCIHGESEWSIKNTKVENIKDVEIPWIRDNFLIEQIRMKALEISDDTSSQNDDDLICLDCLNNLNDAAYTEVSILSHNFADGILTIKNDGSFNFVVLGIKKHSLFVINGVDGNKGNYSVDSVEPSTLKLKVHYIPTVPPTTPLANNNGIRGTSFSYTIKASDVGFKNRTNEGITGINNLISKDKFSNMRYSIKQNMNKYWNSYLATCNLSKKPITNTFYKNNPKCEFLVDNVGSEEGADLLPNNPIMTPFIYSELVFANVDFEDYISLQERIRSIRGYIRTIDNNGRVLKVFPMSVKYVNSKKELVVTGQEKFEPAYLTVVYQNGFVTINNETSIRTLDYKIIDYKVYIFDKEKRRLYNGVFWNQTSLNGAIPSSISELKIWLDLLT